jgi:hypothetical protein
MRIADVAGGHGQLPPLRRAGLQGGDGDCAIAGDLQEKTKCGPLENELVRLRAWIAALENAERIADQAE